MTVHEALRALRRMNIGNDRRVRRMADAVQRMSRVPLWIENEIRFNCDLPGDGTVHRPREPLCPSNVEEPDIFEPDGGDTLPSERRTA